MTSSPSSKARAVVCCEVSVRGLGFGVWGVGGVDVRRYGFRVKGVGFGTQGLGLGPQGSGFRVQGSGRRVQGLRLGFELWV